jgi:lipopolysaccharide transport system ATP-binding protein
LRYISFDVRECDTLGIIGKNGAGKSTLLKLLSRVTSPTTGSIKIKGRIASLLEVGTGFHPEMTGRENIYMNGAILGMTRREISSKFDEIVEFAGVQLYIDTPVKRYSSGMYVRLAFGVAAHLEPEILIVDEVLAVGDAEFQRKCIGKMSDVASHGRTIIFVSHNMQAVQSLCRSAIYMKSGLIAEVGNTDTVINNYLSKEIKNTVDVSWDNEEDAPGGIAVRLMSAKIIPQKTGENGHIFVNTEIWVRFELSVRLDFNANLSAQLYSASGVCIFSAFTKVESLSVGRRVSLLKIPANLLNDDIYSLKLRVLKEGTLVLLRKEDLLVFEVFDLPREGNWFGKWDGAVRPQLDFIFE